MRRRVRVRVRVRIRRGRRNLRWKVRRKARARARARAMLCRGKEMVEFIVENAMAGAMAMDMAGTKAVAGTENVLAQARVSKNAAWKLSKAAK